MYITGMIVDETGSDGDGWKNPEIADIVKYALTASQLEWCVAAPDERSLHKYNECSYYLDTYHRSNCMQASTTYTLPYWMGVYHGIIER